MLVPSEIKTPNEGAKYWRKIIGVETLPAISKEKKPFGTWKKYQTEAASDEEFQNWIDNDKFKDGICILPGKVRHRAAAHLYYIVIDGDKAAGVKELLTRNGHTPTLQEVAEKWIVEQHADDPKKAHFGFYSPIPFPNKVPDSIIGLEVRCDSKGVTNRVVIVSPSIHKDGHPYEIIGTKDPVVLSETQALQLKQHINQICVRNGVEYLTKTGNLRIDAKLKKMIQKLTIDNSIEIMEGQRNDMLIAIADSILFNHSHKHSEDKLRTYFDDINQQLCKPDSLDDGELDQLWDRACKFVEVIKEREKENGNGNYSNGKEQDQETNSDYIPSSILDKLGDNIHLKINDEPIILLIAHKGSGRIVRARVYSHTEGQGPEKYVVYNLSIKNTIIDALPTKVVINESPIDGTKTYQITFLHYGSKRKSPFTVGPNPIKTIIADLQDRGRYVDKDADKFLTGILTKYEDNELAEVNNRVLESGYYYIDKKIVGYDITQRLDQEISKDEVLDCINVMEELRHKYKKQELIPTVIKWGIVAPFSYVKKCHSISGSNWLPALAPYGRKRTGKNTAGVIALAISRKHTVKDKPIHQIGVGSIDSPARFGRAVSQTTYPVMSSEVDLTNEKLKWLVEMIKYEIESTTVRGRYIDRHRFEDIRALSDIILTSNHRPPRDDAFLTRIIPIPFGRKDDTTTEQKKEFEKWLFDDGRIDRLGVLGDFATKQIVNNPDILLNNRWEDTAKIVLTDFYKYVDKKTPEWINYIMDEDVSGQADEETELEIRAFLMNAITEVYSRHLRTLPLEQQKDALDKLLENSSIWPRLDFCLKNQLLPFLHQHKEKNKEYPSIIITSDIMAILKKSNIPSITTLQDLADELDFTFKVITMGGKSVRAIVISRQKFVALLDAKIEESDNDKS